MTDKSVKPRRITVVVLIFGLLAALTHIGLTLVFTGPTTPIKNSLQPGLNRYFLGPLDQGWNLFAPGPYSQDEYFTMRACLSEPEVCAGGAEAGAEFTEWRNVTTEELDTARYNIFSNRGSKQSKVIHGRFWTAASRLNEERKKEISKPFILGEPVFSEDVFTPEADEKFGSELNNLQYYVRLERAAVGFASLYALQEWGGASMVEIRMVRIPVVPFAQRHEENVERKEQDIYIGWRDTIDFPEETEVVWQ